MKQELVNRSIFLGVALMLVLLGGLTACGPSAIKPTVFNTTQPTIVAPSYEVDVLVPGSYFHGIHGLTFDSQDNLYAGSVIGQTIYKIVTKGGKVEISEYIGSPEGLADDLEFGPDGQLYWTSYISGKVRTKAGDKVKALAEGLPGVNSIAFKQDGRLFVGEVFLGDSLYEIDIKGEKAHRVIARGIGGLNGFDFGPDGKLYGPLWFKGEIVRVDVDTGQMETVAEGFKTPAAVNFDSKGNLFVVDTNAGEVVQVDIKTGEKKVIANVLPSIDNLALNSKDELFISNMSTSGIYRVDVKTGKVDTIVEGKLTCPGGIDVAGETIYLADIFALRQIDGNTGEVTTLERSHADHIEYPFAASVKGDKVFLTSWFVGTVQEFDLKTKKITRTFYGFVAPYEVLPLDDGSLLVAELGKGRIVRVSGAEGEKRDVVTEGLVSPIGLALADKNNVYVTEAIVGRVTTVNLTTGEKKVVTSGLAVPEGIAVQANGKILVVETGLRRLVEIDPKSGAKTPIVKDLAIGLISIPETANPFGAMNDVAVSDSGAIYVTGDVENVLYKITRK
jgi:sugar lactone lactonase YvrE